MRGSQRTTVRHNSLPRSDRVQRLSYFISVDKALVVSHEMEDVAQIPPIDVSILIFES